MASKHQKRSSSALDPMMAGFAAGAAAFIIYAMPQATFDQAVSLSGLPMIISAAQPPLGATARFATMAAAGIGSFMLVWLVLRALSKPAPRPKHRSGPVGIEMAPPRLRRADAHPDAPSRRPILAGVDLGRPFDEMPLTEQDPFEQVPGEEEQPLDTLIAAEEQPWNTSLDGEDRETHELPAQDDHYVDDYVDPYQPAYDVQPAFDPVFEEEAEQADDWLPPQEAGIDEPSFDERGAAEEEQEIAEDVSVPHFLVREEQAAEQPEVDFDLARSEVQTVHALSQRLPDAEDDRPASISDLMERLEAGLRRRPPSRWIPSAAPPHSANGAVPASGEAPPHLDARLRGAIQELQKLAARG